jgi:hypothetical protein
MSFASVPGRRLVLAGILAAVVALSGCALGRTLTTTDTTHDGATLHGTVFSTIEEDATYWFEYGRSASLGNRTQTRTAHVSPDLGQDVSERVTGLDPHTSYEFRLCAQGSEPRIPVMCGDRHSFTTAAAVSVTTQPPLQPEFDPDVTDYVTRCTGDPVTAEVAATAGTQVASPSTARRRAAGPSRSPSSWPPANGSASRPPGTT